MGMHKGLPVAGYRAQSQDRVDAVNANKQIEERVLRMLDDMGHGMGDPRWTAIARTHIELGFMAMNRAIFQPGRVVLDSDVPVADGVAS